MKTVFYYTSTYFLDVSLEMINILKDKVNLHVIIEITAQSKNANIINVDKLPSSGYLITPSNLLSKEDNDHLAPFFKGAASVHFVVHRHASGMSSTTLKAVGAVRRFMKKHKPDIVHFEGFTLRTLGLVPYLLSVKKVVMNVHDALLHSGEKSWKSRLPRSVFFNLPVKKAFMFYSAFTMEQFKAQVKHGPAHMHLLHMHPFSYFSSLKDETLVGNKHILFFGRISTYKGVNVLLDAMPAVFKKFPNEKLVIAGSGASNELLQHPAISQYKTNIQIENRYIPNKELVQLLQQSKFVVCPYIDATQSGVLMTAFALNKPVIASKTGAFEEHIMDGWNGILVPASNKERLAAAIITCLERERYVQMQTTIESTNKKNPWRGNSSVLTKAYQII